VSYRLAGEGNITLVLFSGEKRKKDSRSSSYKEEKGGRTYDGDCGLVFLVGMGRKRKESPCGFFLKPDREPFKRKKKKNRILPARSKEDKDPPRALLSQESHVVTHHDSARSWFSREKGEGKPHLGFWPG